MPKTPKPRSEPKPSRTLAILLTLFGCGVGHFYVGLKRRAVIWFLSMATLALVLASALHALGIAMGFGVAFILFLAVLVGGIIGPMVDLARLDRDRFSYVPTSHVFLFWIGIGIVGGVVRFTIQEFLLEAFKIPSGGMMPTLMPGDHLMTDKAVYGRRDPVRGELMVFGFPEKPEQDFIQRVIAKDGDRLEVKAGHPWINGWEVPHCRVGSATFPAVGYGSSAERGEVDVEFLEGNAYLTFYDEASGPFAIAQGPFIAKDGEFWTIGDNRNNSHDSRMWFNGGGGGVPRELVKGRALFIWLATSEDGVDGSRAGMSLSEPHLPKTLQSLQPDLDRCMQSRPAYEKTVPPKP